MAKQLWWLLSNRILFISLLWWSWFTVEAAIEQVCPLQCQCTEGQVNCTQVGFSQFPKTLPNNTHTLILTRNDIKEVRQEFLEPYTQLKTLVLSYNQISSFELTGQLQLEILDVSHNAIEHLSFLAQLPKLSFLNVAFNQLARLGNETLIANNKLQWLSFNSNPLSVIPSGLFRRNEFIKFAYLSALEISNIPPRVLDPLTRLEHLEIRQNRKLRNLPDDLFHYLGSLRNLSMGNNNLTSIPRSIRELDSLRSLNLDDNPFRCDCQLYWFANWLEKKGAKFERSKSMICSDNLPLVEQLWRLQCSPVRLQTSSFKQEAIMGQSVILTCNFTGNPAPHITWVTPGRKIIQWPQSESQLQSNDTTRVTLMSPDQLRVESLSRESAGDYACHASNPLSNVTAFLKVQITPSGFRRAQIQSIIVGFACVLGFAVITLIVQGFRYLMDRFGWWECCYCCGKRLSPRAKQIRHALEAVEQYKSQQLDRLRDNYNAQVHRIRDNCVQQMERIQNSYQGQVKYLRGVRDYGTQQLTTIREQYNDQAKRVYDYTCDRLHTVQRNYVTQRARVRKFSAHQLSRLSEKYKFQQKTLNKIFENLPAFYIDNCRTASCARTDSVYFDDEPDVDVVDSIIKQGITTLQLTEVSLEDSSLGLPEEEIAITDAENPIDSTETDSATKSRKKVGHGRHPSTSSIDFSFLFPPIRFPSRLQWRRRNTVDEETDSTNKESETNYEEGVSINSVQVSVEICPEPKVDDTLVDEESKPADC